MFVKSPNHIFWTLTFLQTSLSPLAFISLPYSNRFLYNIPDFVKINLQVIQNFLVQLILHLWILLYIYIYAKYKTISL